MADCSGSRVLDSFVVEAEDPEAFSAFFRGIEKELERGGGLDPLVADECLEDFAFARFLAGDDPAHPVFGIDVSSGLIEERGVLDRVPGFVTVVEFDLAEGVGVEVEKRTLEQFLGDALDDEDIAILDGFAFDDAGLDLQEALLEALRRLPPLEIEGNANLLGSLSRKGAA